MRLQHGIRTSSPSVSRPPPESSHPTIRAMCGNATLPLASRARRPRDLLPHSVPSGLPPRGCLSVRDSAASIHHVSPDLDWTFQLRFAPLHLHLRHVSTQGSSQVGVFRNIPTDNECNCVGYSSSSDCGYCRRSRGGQSQKRESPSVSCRILRVRLTCIRASPVCPPPNSLFPSRSQWGYPGQALPCHDPLSKLMAVSDPGSMQAIPIMPSQHP